MAPGWSAPGTDLAFLVGPSSPSPGMALMGGPARTSLLDQTGNGGAGLSRHFDRRTTARIAREPSCLPAVPIRSPGVEERQDQRQPPAELVREDEDRHRGWPVPPDDQKPTDGIATRPGRPVVRMDRRQEHLLPAVGPSYSPLEGCGVPERRGCFTHLFFERPSPWSREPFSRWQCYVWPPRRR